LQEFVDSQSSLEDNSKHQASLQYIQSHNRGLTNVSDEYYEYTLAVETSWDSCKIARDEVKEDPQVKMAFDKLVSTPDLLSTVHQGIAKTVNNRLSRRYLNMRCKEYVKV
jgi:cell fate (sporulation/competence/biofilm development) regulator YmcA (YheA/YmcA/DUF963 family)